MNQRSNDQWLADLADGNPNRPQAIRDLRDIIFNGLRRGLSGQVDVVGADFDALIDDFTQDALLKIVDRADTFEGRSRFTTWGHKIALNVALSELRRKRWRDKSLDTMLETDDGDYTPKFVADAKPSPEATSAQAEMLVKVQQLIQEELTEKQRTVLVSTAIQGISPAEVAAQLNMKPNAVYKVLHDARSRLKKLLARDGLTTADVLGVFGS